MCITNTNSFSSFILAECRRSSTTSADNKDNNNIGTNETTNNK